MIKRIFQALLFTLITFSCQKEQKQDPFEITPNRIGFLTNETKISQLDSIFAMDSIAKLIPSGTSFNSTTEFEIYEKGGNKLLVLEAGKESDPTATIENIQVIDPRYKTPSGISSKSMFKDIKDHYTISKINNTLSTAVVFVDSIQAYFTIDKKQLPGEFQNTTDTKIKASDIPDSAKIKHFWIRWDANE